MKTYNLYINSNPKEQGQIVDIIALAENFNWQCFIFNIFWAVYKGSWKLFTTYLMLFLILSITKRYTAIDNNSLMIIFMMISVILAFYANDILGKMLLAKEYKYGGIVMANSEDEAILRFDHGHNSPGRETV